MYAFHSESQLLSYKPYKGITPAKGPSLKFKIFGSCNGILCLYEYRYNRILYLWNPSIRRKVVIHNLPSWSDDYLVHGFGFDTIIDDYKVLRIDTPHSFVYTVKTHTWRAITCPMGLFTFVKRHQCLFNGVLHWPVKRYINYIMTFDLSSDQFFSTVEVPNPSWEINEVTIIKGCLGVINSDHHDHSWIWVRREYNNNIFASWSVAYKLDTNPFQRVLQITLNDELLCYCFKKGITVYNPVTQEQRKLVNLRAFSRIRAMIMCGESLELLDMRTSRGKKRSRSLGKKRSRTSEIMQT